MMEDLIRIGQIVYVSNSKGYCARTKSHRYQNEWKPGVVLEIDFYDRGVDQYYDVYASVYYRGRIVYCYVINLKV